ncbi:iron ABC transporter permease [Corynebacterium aquilae DSM 44791]|uniref:Iron ABC transporter permease n=1 Tax=Corynebacterium aquilae DSM 44791 TaxID=1431546 RepID=A0A1L7CHG0_9CORY|nr:iron ABC transporter permease [Corynebacterium aquilae DSM 44791]
MRIGAAFAVLGLLSVLVIGSLMLGSGDLSPLEAVKLLLHPDDSFASTVVHGQRIPRTLLIIMVGAALGVAGALMQSLTRNPLADPGVLGVNAGAALAVVLSVAIFGRTSIWFYLWFAFIGAAIASVVVYALGGVASRTATPARLALAGVAVTMTVSSFVQIVILADKNAFNEFRLWAAGSAEGRGYPILEATSLFIIAGLILAFALTPGLNALALGDDAGKALGVRVTRLRTLVMIAVTVLAGAATAAIGPVMFIGLAVPYLARTVAGADMRWAVPLCALIAPVVLLAADIAARLIIAPQEIQTGVATAILGAPFFIAVVRRRKVAIA